MISKLMGLRQRSELCVQLRAVDSAPDVRKLAFFKMGSYSRMLPRHAHVRRIVG